MVRAKGGAVHRPDGASRWHGSRQIDYFIHLNARMGQRPPVWHDWDESDHKPILAWIAMQGARDKPLPNMKKHAD